MKHWIKLIFATLALSLTIYALAIHDNSESMVYAVEISPTTTVLPTIPGRLAPMENYLFTPGGSSLIINWIDSLKSFNSLGKDPDTLSVVLSGGKILLFNIRPEVVHAIRLNLIGTFQEFKALDYSRDEKHLYILGVAGRDWFNSIFLIFIASCIFGGLITHSAYQIRKQRKLNIRDEDNYGL
jgi:hypothetical protein